MSTPTRTEDPEEVDSRTWLDHWEPEDPEFWEETGKPIAWRTLWLTTFSLTMAFVVWFVVSALVVRLPDVGFALDTGQLFWLAAMPGLAGGTLRILHTFLIPIYGTRHVVSISTLLLLIPLGGWFFAVQDLSTPFWILMVLAFAAGLGGGNFSSFMPSTSLFFPKRKQGTALGIQAGVGNFGVSLVQFVTPWVIGVVALGGLAFVGSSQQLTLADGSVREVWLQNATLIWIPFVLIAGILSWLMLRSVPVRADFREQLDIFRDKHTWLMTSLYVMTFGSFAGFSAAFPLLIRDSYGHLENAPDPLTYAFLGPLIGSAMRVVAGPVSDRLGGARVTQIAGAGMVASTVGVMFFTSPDSMSDFPWFVAFMLGIFFFSGIGNASVYKQVPMLFETRQASGVLGWIAAVAAYGPFIVSSLVGETIEATGSPNPFFVGIAIFFVANIGINWWYYARRNAPHPC
ncbi:MAG: nitrate/nitrite transporter [Nitriliruptorales bacterium]|nr:nitrate/nitrite transporter [Nitriliruptorales bacterium]